VLKDKLYLDFLQIVEVQVVLCNYVRENNLIRLSFVPNQGQDSSLDLDLKFNSIFTEENPLNIWVDYQLYQNLWIKHEIGYDFNLGYILSLGFGHWSDSIDFGFWLQFLSLNQIQSYFQGDGYTIDSFQRFSISKYDTYENTLFISNNQILKDIGVPLVV
jgi:hypothetical protein